MQALRAKGTTCPLFLITSGGGLAALETARKFPIRLVESGPAGGAILAVAVSMLASFTLLPALIALLGDRLDAGRLPWPRFATGSRTGSAAARVVTRWPLHVCGCSVP